MERGSAVRAGASLLAEHAEVILDSMVEGLVVIDAAGIITCFNSAAERIFGYEASEVAGRNVSLLMPPPWSREHDQYLARYSHTREGRIIGLGREVRGRRKNGQVFPMELSVGAFNAEGEPHYVGVIRDSSETRGMQATIAAREAQLRLMFDQAPVGTFIADREGRFISCNTAFERLLGATDRAFIGREHRDFVHPEDRGALCAVFAALRADSRTGARCTSEMRYVREDGGLAHVQLHVGLVDTLEGDRAFIGQCIDRSAQYRAEEELAALHDQLAHVNRLSVMGEMASGIAHEINQPLTAISAYAQACRRMVTAGPVDPGDADFTDALDQIARQAQRAGEVIRRLRGFVRRGESSRATTQLGDVLRGVVKLAEVDARNHDIAIERSIPISLPSVLADAVQIQQVVLNLLRNAMEATPSGEAADGNRMVSLRAEADGGAVRVSVLDHGRGIEPGGIERLFTPFFTTKRTGMGLGLSICRSIIEAHGGSIEYHARNGGGSCFQFTLPVAPGEPGGVG